jgi:spore coat protein CotF
MQWIRLAWSLARFKAGIKIAINTAMMAITTNSSISVKALVFIGIAPY